MAADDAGAAASLTVALVGPESCGKTTLARAVATHYGVTAVAECARGYLEALAEPAAYDSADLDAIARSQQAAESAHADAPIKVLDTDLLVIDIWWRERFGQPPTWLEDALTRAAADPWRHYLLCAPDLPWEPDPLRENPGDRARLFTRYEARLRQLSARYRVIAGAGATRTRAAIAAVERWQVDIDASG